MVDLCAGGGGKTLALAAAMEDRVRLIATDGDPARLRKALPRVRRSGAAIVETADHAAVLRDLGRSADLVIADVPCTGSGAWRRDPAAKWRTTPETLTAAVAAQRPILDAAAGLVRPGGRLAYVTCSVFAAENGDQIPAFLARHPAFRPAPVAPAWEAILGGAPPGGGDAVQLTPLGTGTDGFFVALLERAQ